MFWGKAPVPCLASDSYLILQGLVHRGSWASGSESAPLVLNPKAADSLPATCRACLLSLLGATLTIPYQPLTRVGSLLRGVQVHTRAQLIGPSLQTAWERGQNLPLWHLQAQRLLWACSTTIRLSR